MSLWPPMESVHSGEGRAVEGFWEGWGLLKNKEGRGDVSVHSSAIHSLLLACTAPRRRATVRWLAHVTALSIPSHTPCVAVRVRFSTRFAGNAGRGSGVRAPVI